MRNTRSSISKIVLVALGVCFLLALGPGFLAAKDGAGPVHQHVVQAGESLWSLAERFSPNEDPRQFVFDVATINDLESSRVFPGQTLILPTG